MKYSAASILLMTAAWTVQAVPTAIPSMGGHARGLPYNAVRSIQSQRKRQESTAVSGAAVPDVTNFLDIPTSDPLPPTTVAIVTSDPAMITSVAIFPRQDVPPTTTDVITSEPTAATSDGGIPTSEPLPPTTTDVITSEPTAITSIPDGPTSEPLPPTTTAAITSEPIAVPQSFRVKVRQGTVTVVPSHAATPIETVPVDSPTANPETPSGTFVAIPPATDTATPPSTTV